MSKMKLESMKEFTIGEDGVPGMMDALSKVVQEIRIWILLSEQEDVNYFGKLVEVIDDESEDLLFLVSEFYSHGQLMRWDASCGKYNLQNLEIRSISRKLLRQMILALHYMKSRLIAHRDIKVSPFFL